MRIRKVQNSREMEAVIDEYITLGYREKERGQDTVRMFRSGGYGSLFVHFILFYFTFYTFGLLNIAYLIYSYYEGARADNVMIKYTNISEIERVNQKVQEGY
ncbi:MAG: hypothetical protein LBD03_05105 [Methanobrevibacter sp.]|jgi:hypothetical protein|nr:hypothetical protein [Candidatus Methanovirga procula]